jgi:hypothetical protein
MLRKRKEDEMSNQKDLVSTQNEVPVVTSSTYTDAAQALIEGVRAMRPQIPKLVTAVSSGDAKRLSPAASVPPQFVELTSVAVKNSTAQVGAGLDPEQIRDQMAYAGAFLPVSDELEALAQFIRHSVMTAKHQAGSAALTTYALMKVLAKRPGTTDLAPHVQDMQKALGRRNRKAKSQPAPTPASPGPTQPSPSTSTSPVTPTKTS